MVSEEFKDPPLKSNDRYILARMTSHHYNVRETIVKLA